MGAVTFAASFLEAAINELYADAVDGVQDRIKHLAPAVAIRLAAVWALMKEERGRSFLTKYQVALRLAERAEFARGKAPLQDVEALSALRNALVHFVPEWATGGAGRETDATSSAHLQSRLYGRFDPNPFVAAGNSFFPGKCLGHGGARWAVETAIAFADDFFARMEVPPFHDLIRARLDAD